jgi:hypothetical protein
MTATVIATTDAGQADRFRDEHGNEWAYYADAMDGTIAVNACDDMGNSTGRAGVFRWDVGTKASGTIYRAQDGDTYDCGNPGEFVVKNGTWLVAE